MTETLETLRALLAGLSDEELRRPEGPGRWSLLDVLSHLGDLEMVYAVRMRDILAGSGDRALQPLAQNAWVERVHRREDETVEELLEQFAFHRRMNLALFSRLSEEEWERKGVHPQYGALSVRDAKGRIERHDAKHLAQMERIKACFA
ncbi:MAG TPA: DinB family protein [Thermoanaerobaculia bacterium]|nr:DinB family protein [Thermoanaerobaculia bacterium]